MDARPPSIYHETRSNPSDHRVHENRPTPDLQRAPAPASVAYSALAVASRLPSVEKQQAALNLLQLSQGPGTGIDMLVRAMMVSCVLFCLYAALANDGLFLVRGQPSHGHHGSTG